MYDAQQSIVTVTYLDEVVFACVSCFISFVDVSRHRHQYDGFFHSFILVIMVNIIVANCADKHSKMVGNFRIRIIRRAKISRLGYVSPTIDIALIATKQKSRILLSIAESISITADKI